MQPRKLAPLLSVALSLTFIVVDALEVQLWLPCAVAPLHPMARDVLLCLLGGCRAAAIGGGSNEWVDRSAHC